MDKRISTRKAVEQLIAHIYDHQRRRDEAKPLSKERAPTDEEREKRSCLMDQVLEAFNWSRSRMLSELNIQPITWDRWRGMKTIPQRVHCETLKMLADEYELGPLSLGKQFTEEMLKVVGISPEQLSQLSWLAEAQIALGVSMSEDACKTLLADRKRSQSQDPEDE